jgi:RNA polymerase sigma factor (sigma-70 family)
MGRRDTTLYGNESAAVGRQEAGNSRARAYLQKFLQDNAVPLQTILCGYVVKMGLASGAAVTNVAAEVFQDAAMETLAHADRFNPEMQPRAWFLAIAANILKRHRASYAKRYKFEVSLGGMASKSELASEQDVLDLIMPTTEAGPEQTLERNEAVHELLNMVSPEDARLLNMTFIQGWDATALGQSIGVSPGAARVRIHRALSRLREALRQSEQREEQGKYHG